MANKRVSINVDAEKLAGLIRCITHQALPPHEDSFIDVGIFTDAKGRPAKVRIQLMRSLDENEIFPDFKCVEEVKA